MTATFTEPDTLAELAAMERAASACIRAGFITWPSPELRAALVNLADAMGVYSDIRSDRLHPASEWPDLEHEPEAFHVALSRAAQDVADLTGELERLTAESGDEGIEAA